MALPPYRASDCCVIRGEYMGAPGTPEPQLLERWGLQ